MTIIPAAAPSIDANARGRYRGLAVTMAPTASSATPVTLGTTVDEP